MSFVLIIALILVAFSLVCFLYAAAAWYNEKHEEIEQEREEGDWQWPTR